MLMSYNGTLLPEIPSDINIDEYPYIFIRDNNSQNVYDLSCSTDPYYYETSTGYLRSTRGTQKWYKISKTGTIDEDTQWSIFQTKTGGDYWTLDSVRTVLWSLGDIYIGSETGTEIYYSGSNPEDPFATIVDYNSIDDIVAGVSNAVKIVDNTKYDDNTYTTKGVDWFTYAGTVCNKIYANGNGWIGFGSSSEHLKVNRRDQAMLNLWREEGTLNEYKFLRIRWSGYTAYNTTSESSLLTFDVIIFETGDIMLYIVDVPTSNYSGTFSLGSLSYTKPTADNRYVSFYKQEDGSYIVDYAPITYSVKKYLIRDSGTLYTVVDGALSELTGDLNSELFITSGADSIPDGALLLPLNAPEVLCWTDGANVPILAATVQGVPTGEHDIISDNIRVGHSSIYGITSVDAIASDGARFLLSFDGGLWMAYNEGSWVATDVGMTATELVAITTEAWSSMINSATYMQLKATIDGVDTVTQVKFNFNNASPVNTVTESEV